MHGHVRPKSSLWWVVKSSPNDWNFTYPSLLVSKYTGNPCPPPATNYPYWDQSLCALNLKLYVPHFIVTASHADGVSLPHYIPFSKWVIVDLALLIKLHCLAILWKEMLGYEICSIKIRLPAPEWWRVLILVVLAILLGDLQCRIWVDLGRKFVMN